MSSLVWVELDSGAPDHNLRELRKGLARGCLLCATVKSNAYGHGVKEMIGLLPSADWFAVNSFEEGVELRALGVERPILLLGYLPASQVRDAVAADLRLTVYNEETIRALSALDLGGRKARVHIKVETGTGRQGVVIDELEAFAEPLLESPTVEVEGILTHYATADDTVDPSYALSQLKRFRGAIDRLRAREISPPVVHTACTAACILYPEMHFSMVRVGIGVYGLWPSRETYVTARCRIADPPKLVPVLSWKTRLAQVKPLPQGSFIGYGCTYRTTRSTTLGVLPVGYADGYDRSLGNTAHVLVRGRRAPVLGRVCMNLTMVDLTDVPRVAVEDEVTLLGRDGEEEITADTFGSWLGTINYEVVTRISPLLPRRIVSESVGL